MKSWHIVIYVVVALLGFSIVTVYSVDISTFDSNSEFKMNDLNFSKLHATLTDSRLANEIVINELGPTTTIHTASKKALLEAFNKILKMRDFYSKIDAGKYKTLLSRDMQQLLCKAQVSGATLTDEDYSILNRALLVAVYPQEIRKTSNGYCFTKQLVWIIIGALVLVIMANVDYHNLQKFSIPLLAVAAVLLMMVWIPGIGTKINYSSRWIRFTSTVGIQPSEFAKLAVIIFLAAYIEKYHNRMSTIMYGFIIPLSIVMVVVGLVYNEPDLGTSALIVLISVTMLIVGGAKIQYVLFAALAVTPLLYIKSKSYQNTRITDFINSLTDSSQAHYHIQQSLIAIGSGGLTGLGLGGSKQKLYFLPESSSDFVFTIISEEYGFIGVVVIISLFLLFVWQGLKIIHRTKDVFGFFLGLGITFMFGLQAIINIAVVSGSIPQKGIPLPFVSSGGSSLLFSMMAIGILVNIARKSEAAPLVETREEWGATEDAAVRRLPSRVWHSITTRVAGFSW